MGVGSVLKRMDSKKLSRALQRATQEPRQIARAKEIGKKIREVSRKTHGKAQIIESF